MSLVWAGSISLDSTFKSSVVDLDPDPRAWKLIKINKQKIGFSAFQKGFCTFIGVFFDILPTLSIFFMQKFNFLRL
jgi:hypothetical protein